MYSSKSIRIEREREREREREKEKWQTSTNSQIEKARSGYYHGKCLSTSSLVLLGTVLHCGNHLMNMMMRHYEWKWTRVVNEFLISLSFRSLLLLLTHMHTLDAYLSASSNYQKNGWSAIIDSSQWTTGSRRLFYYNHRSFIHMQATNEWNEQMRDKPISTCIRII
jgi:hypothetical protein